MTCIHLKVSTGVGVGVVRRVLLVRVGVERDVDVGPGTTRFSSSSGTRPTPHPSSGGWCPFIPPSSRFGDRGRGDRATGNEFSVLKFLF